ncbi:MAG TPA: carboxypeptidase-like regulatory domain-containing protein [Candidatus Acidoferrales bacterium]|nr:carboxypeptidase-like regulatory domain-containing protein [Candidatus Acidoferrales bacterium]
MLLKCRFLVIATALAIVPVLAWGQTGTAGSLTVSVVDPSGAVVPGANLELTDVSTNVVRKAATLDTGVYSFPNLPFGVYKLAVAQSGFSTQEFTNIQVQTGRNTDVKVTLRVAAAAETVQVNATETPLIETSSSVLASTIDTKQVVILPMQTRNVYNMTFLVPGWASTGANSTVGTFNNLPGGAIVSADFDGTPGISNRFRSGGYQYGTVVVQPRIEQVAEMTIQSAQLDLAGTGTSAMRINIVTRRGSNAFHGRLFEDFRNTSLNANSWLSNARGIPRTVLKLNDFGGAVSGPAIKNKLFFFGTYAQSIQPNSTTATATYLSPAAQQGLFSYRDTRGALQTVNVLQIGQAAGGPGTVLPSIAGQFSEINGVVNQGVLTQNPSDPNLATLSWLVPQRTTIWYPTVRVDYNLTEKLRFNASYSQTKTYNEHNYTPLWPGGIDTVDYTSSGGNNKIAGFGFDWMLKPTLINQFHSGFTYQYSYFSPENKGIDLTSIQQINFAYGQGLYGGPTGGVYPRLPVSSLYPLFNFEDSVNWQKGSHQFTFGGGWWREQDHYWNNPGGFPNINLGMAANDPLVPAFLAALPTSGGASTVNQANAEALYATLTGRISSVNINTGRPLDPATKQYKPYGQYNLNEVVAATHFFAQDRWRIRPNLTFNYGLRWDIYGDDHDINGGYSSPASVADFWGPTPVGAIFQPGNLGGVQNPTFTAKVHVYKTQWVNPQPAAGLIWSPRAEGLMGKILGRDKTVIKAGWSLRNYLEGAQNFWAYASNQGAFFYQFGSLTADTSGAVGTFKPGSLTLGQPLPPYALTPPQWSSTVPAAQLWPGNSFWAMNPNIRYPYVEQYNFGIQREVAQGTVLEVRYVGNMAMHSWMSYNINEPNIYENGFLTEFQHAQANLAINQANGKGSTLANNGLPGQYALPILQAAFAGAGSGGYTAFTTNLQTGAAGAMANTIARNQTYFCNMVGSQKFAPCASAFGGNTNVPGNYPSNFFEVNPYTTGLSLNYLDAMGHSNYNSLQIELRQRQVHGMQFNVNYTLSHALLLGPANAYQGNVTSQNGFVAGLFLSDRNFRMNYGPSPFDVRHIIHASGTYDLPFGKGKMFLNQNKVVDHIVGGWTLGTIVVFQTGTLAQMNGGYNTVNANDAGLVFQNGFTASQLQSNVGVYHSGNPFVYVFDPGKFLAPNGSANTNYMTPITTAGAWGYRPMIYGPHWFNADLSVNKTIPIRESIRLLFQGEFLNLFNHPTFSFANTTPLNIQSTAFGQLTSGPTTARRIELRANLEF